MYIETNLGVNFTSYDDLIRYMKEEGIFSVVITLSFPNWGITIRKNENFTLEELITESEELNKLLKEDK